MVTAIDKHGNSHTYTLNIDYIIELEDADSTYSFMEDVSKLGDTLRISNLNRVCKALGSDVKEMLALGFTIEKIANIFTECMREAGFISEKPEPTPSSAE